VYLDENGKENPMVMGCYGIGINRSMAAVIEQNNDENGIIWPISVAPYHVIVIPVNTSDSDQMGLAEKIYSELMARGVEVMLDDRDERPGVKFKDADLIGFPIRVTIGPKSLEQGEMEIIIRRTKEKISVPVEEVLTIIRQILEDGDVK
jgi:prolyl-tRNA synthetase